MNIIIFAVIVTCVIAAAIGIMVLIIGGIYDQGYNLGYKEGKHEMQELVNLSIMDNYPDDDPQCSFSWK